MVEIKDYDSILKQAFREYMDNLLESDIYRDDEFETSVNFEKKMSKMLKSEHNFYHKVTLTTFRKVICIAIVIITLMLSSLSVGAVRDFMVDFFIEHFSVYDTVTSTKEEIKEHPKTLEKIYVLEDIPQNYVLADESLIDNDITYIYIDDEGKDIVFSQSTYDSFVLNVDNEHTKKYSETVNGQEYMVNVFDSEDLIYPRITLIWDDGEYIFCLSANLPKEDMYNLCNSMKIK